MHIEPMPIHVMPPSQFLKIHSGARNAGMLVGPGFFAVVAFAVKQGQDVSPATRRGVWQTDPCSWHKLQMIFKWRVLCSWNQVDEPDTH